MQPDLERVYAALSSSHFLRVLLLGFLVILLQIPVFLVSGQIGERQGLQQEAVAEVTGKWGGAQTSSGPFLTVPYLARWTVTDEKGKPAERSELRHATFLPDELTIQARLESEVRSRGIFDVELYVLSLEAKGRYREIDLSDWRVTPEDVRWADAELRVHVSDPRGIQQQTSLLWHAVEHPFLPGTGRFGGTAGGVHTRVADVGAAGTEFAFKLSLQGSGAAYFTPLGRDTRVSLSSNWPHPSFQGAWLPSTRNVTAAGFDASWSIPFLSRNFAQRWTSESDPGEALSSSWFGVSLNSPIDPYRMAERSVKYDLLFIGLTFAALWLFEVLAGVRIHPVQYLLIGSAMCLFYLLELALSEHLGFEIAYAVASAAIVTAIAAYAVSVLRSGSRAAWIGALVAALYGYLYVLLRNEDYALLIGSIGLFAALAATMWLTRKVDWYRAGS
jgi:inner membrane protein